MHAPSCFRFLAPAVLAAVLAAPASAQTPTTDSIGTAPPAKATIQQVAWIAGQWVGMLGDRHIEQHWMPPLGPSMVAAYRNVQGTDPKLYEILTIEEFEGGLVLRIKHFTPGPGLASREAQNEAAEHRLVKVDGQRAVFESTGANPLRITFSKPAGDQLSIVLDRLRDGQPQRTVFAYTQRTK